MITLRKGKKKQETLNIKKKNSIIHKYKTLTKLLIEISKSYYKWKMAK
jgi:hypothetical protein